MFPAPNFLPTIGMGGYAYAYADMGGSAACLNGTAFCAKGSVVAANPPTYSYYGAGVGVNLNQPQGTMAKGVFAASGKGISYTLSNLPSPNPVRLIVDNGGVDYCNTLTSPSGTVLWGSFYAQCYNLPGGDAGASLGSAPMATNIKFQVTTAMAAGTFDFCVDALSFAP